MPIVLHIGSPKTATSSIQSFARRHGDALRRRGLDYPPTDLAGGPRWGTHSALARTAAGQAVPGFDPTWFVAEVRRRASTSTVLLSAEALYLGRFPADPAGDTAELDRHDAFVGRVRRLFGGDPPSVRLVLRRRDSFAGSLYQQIVQSDRYPAPFETFLESHRVLFDYRRIVEIWARHFPEIAILVFEDLVAGPGPVANFLGGLGIDVSDLEAERRNVAIPLEVTEFVRHLNATDMPEEALRRVRARLKDEPLRRLFAGGNRRSHFAPGQVGSFLAPYDADDAWLLQRYRPTRRATLFPAPATEDDRFEGIDAATAARVAAHLLAQTGAALPAAPWFGPLRGRWRRPWKRP